MAHDWNLEDDLFGEQRKLEDDLFGGPRKPEEDLFGERRNPEEDLFGEQMKPGEDLFGELSKPEDTHTTSVVPWNVGDNGAVEANKPEDNAVERIAPNSTGKGLPYAPVDWPNPGDVWSWKVGRRVKASGFFNDRFMYGPESLQEKPGKQLFFQSKPAVIRYLQSKFPNFDIDAFFASFTWEIPAKEEYVNANVKQGKEVDTHAEALPPRKRSAVIQVEAPAPPPSLRKREPRKTVEVDASAETPSPHPSRKRPAKKPKSDEGSSSKRVRKSAPRGKAKQSDIQLVAINVPFQQESNPPEETEIVPEDFDNYLGSLDEMLSLPSPEMSRSAVRENMTETRAKLSSLLAMGFSDLVASKKLHQLTSLSSKLIQSDPTLSPTELSMLKLIQEIPLVSSNFLEAEKLVNNADNFFTDLNEKMARVASLKNEYNVAKEQLEQSHARESAALLSLLEIDEQIAALQARRAQLTQSIKGTNKEIVQYTSGQKKVMGSLPKIVREVQAANAEKEEWELKKKRSAEHVQEIRARFSPLQGFSF